MGKGNRPSIEVYYGCREKWLVDKDEHPESMLLYWVNHRMILVLKIVSTCS